MSLEAVGREWTSEGSAAEIPLLRDVLRDDIARKAPLLAQ